MRAETLAVIAACAALVLVGVVIVARSGGRTSSPGRLSVRDAGVAVAAGLVAGVLAAGAGGRLVMRLLAATSPEATGSFTEADEIVGSTSVDGTLALILFAGLPAGLLSGLLYAVVRPALPRGRAGGLILGAMLLILAATRLDPLRADNFDFALVGPASLAVLAFTALALFHGMLVVALAARISNSSGPPPAAGWSPRSASAPVSRSWSRSRLPRRGDGHPAGRLMRLEGRGDLGHRRAGPARPPGRRPRGSRACA